jgi:hypothetical protein
MSIEQANTIDFLIHDKKGRRAVMFISDHLGWEQDEDGHLELLQDKLNHYIWAIEHGKIVEAMPELKGLPVSVVVWGDHPLSNDAQRFYDLAKARASELGFTLDFDLDGKSFENR